MANYKNGSGKPIMPNHLSKRESWLLAVVVVILVVVSVWQNATLRAIHQELKKAHYAERVRTAQLILEGEMLRAAYFTTLNNHTKRMAQTYLEKFPR